MQRKVDVHNTFIFQEYMAKPRVLFRWEGVELWQGMG